MKKSKMILKIFLIVVLIIAIPCVYFCWMAGIPTITHHKQKYADVYRNSTMDYVMFDESDFGKYDSLEYQVRDRDAIWHTIGSMYIVKYTPKQYKTQINNINRNRTFYNKNPESLGECIAHKNNWTIRIENRSEEDYEVPHRFTMIGTNDKECTILYMAFNDNDFDGTDNLIELIEEEFDYHFD